MRTTIIVILLLLMTVAGFCGYGVIRQDIAEKSAQMSKMQSETISFMAKDQIRQRIEGDACHTRSHEYAELAYPRALYPNEEDRAQLMTEYKQIFTAMYCF